jgi:mutator protein MutT
MAAQLDVAIGILWREGKILICRRREQDPLGGYWEFPGGKCEPAESPEACVVRELLEELGVVVRAVESLARIEHEYPHARVRLHPFLCRLETGEPAALAAIECRWISPAALADYRFPAANDSLLESLGHRFC